MDTSAPDTFQQAVLLVQMGDTDRAAYLFRKTVEQAPSCLEAWLWLSELARDLEEQTAMLEEAIKRIPPNSSKTLQDYLSDLHSAPALPSPQPTVEAGTFGAMHFPGIKNPEDGYRQASRLASQGKRAEALRILYLVVSSGAHDERSWWMISELEPGIEGKISALLWVLEMNPNHTEARKRLKVLQNMGNQPESAANFFASIGETQQAVDIYQLLASKEMNPARKRELELRISMLEPRSTVQTAAPQSKPAADIGKDLLGFMRSLFS